MFEASQKTEALTEVVVSNLEYQRLSVSVNGQETLKTINILLILILEHQVLKIILKCVIKMTKIKHDNGPMHKVGLLC